MSESTLKFFLVYSMATHLITICLWLYREYSHSKKESALIDRIMSKDLREYKINSEQAPDKVRFKKPTLTDNQMAKKERERLIEQEEMTKTAMLQQTRDDIEEALEGINPDVVAGSRS